MGEVDIIILAMIIGPVFMLLLRRVYLLQSFLNELQKKYPEKYQEWGAPKVVNSMHGWYIQAQDLESSYGAQDRYTQKILNHFKNRIRNAEKALWYETLFDRSSFWVSIVILIAIMWFLSYVYENKERLAEIRAQHAQSTN